MYKAAGTFFHNDFEIIKTRDIKVMGDAMMIFVKSYQKSYVLTRRK